jgi:hypothetical protein
MYGETFKGYLLKFTKTNALFPNEFISADTFKATPRQRTEIKAYRDSLNKLHRTTSPNHKSKLVFSTTALTLSELRKILNLFDKAYSNKTQRKVSVEYWDDELLSYRTMTAYLADVTYTKEKITSDDISYSSVEFTLVEY